MKSIYHDNFLLRNRYSERLYHEIASTLPIIDPHNHVDPAALATNRRFENIYQLWVQNDPYKHRAMRIGGGPELFITGGARSDELNFDLWAGCLPNTVGNPLFHWTALELKEVFGVDEMLTPSTSQDIWKRANEQLQGEGFGALDIVKKLGVETLCTSDDLLDSLEHHKVLAAQSTGIICLPSLRSDSILGLDNAWIQKLRKLTDTSIGDLTTYKSAISLRLDFFNQAGCLLSDHSLDSGFRFVPTDEETAIAVFLKVLNGEVLSHSENTALQSHLLQWLGLEYAKRRWKMQLHLGAHRFTSSVLRAKLGPAGGYAGIGNTVHVESLCLFLDALDKEGGLPKTILYTLNPADNAVLATLTGSFSEDYVPGKVQFGPAWWYNDHYEGIRQQLLELSSYGLLSTSIGFTTDSRSILSLTRHGYYRRILCNLIGEWMEERHLPDDFEFASELIKNICYYNIKNWIKK